MGNETNSVEEGERMVLPLSPDERDTANWFVDLFLDDFSRNCGGKCRPIPSLLDGFVRDIICGKDARYLNWDGENFGFSEEFLLAIEDDAQFDPDVSDEFFFDGCKYFEECLSDMVTSLLGHHAFRAAHNALNVLVAFERLFRWKQAAMEEDLKQPGKETSLPF